MYTFLSIVAILDVFFNVNSSQGYTVITAWSTTVYMYNCTTVQYMHSELFLYKQMNINKNDLLVKFRFVFCKKKKDVQ